MRNHSFLQISSPHRTLLERILLEVPVRLLPVLVLLLTAACSSPSTGGGAFVDVHGGCSAAAKAADICSQLTPTDASATADQSGPDGEDGALADATLGGGDAGTDDGGFADDATDNGSTDLDGFFDNPDGDAATGADTILPNGDCPERAKIVYVVTTDNKLYSFQPDKLLFKLVGTLKCPAGFGSSPFSMSVDRQANAWVLYWNGANATGIYKVSTLDASCTTTSYKTASSNLEIFGMGFSANGPGQTDETLYVIAGSVSSYWSGIDTLASISFPGLQASAVKSLDFAGGAELTGNGKGELFGFFAGSSPPSVRQIDKITGKTNVTNWNLPTSDFGSEGDVAFAQWGGVFYLFYQGPADSSTNVWKLDTATGKATVAKANTGLTIVGAGVSSCAPTAFVP